MTIAELKKNYIEKTGGHFFERETLKYFGETMKDMHIMPHLNIVSDYKGLKHNCYTVSIKQRPQDMPPRIAIFHFDADTFEIVNTL
jgi:hypothetical protein